MDNKYWKGKVIKCAAFLKRRHDWSDDEREGAPKLLLYYVRLHCFGPVSFCQLRCVLMFSVSFRVSSVLVVNDECFICVVRGDESRMNVARVSYIYNVIDKCCNYMFRSIGYTVYYSFFFFF